MNEKARETINEDIMNAASTCNQVVTLMQSDDMPNSQNGLMNIVIMSLVGINQALVAIAEAIACKQEDPNG